MTESAREERKATGTSSQTKRRRRNRRRSQRASAAGAKTPPTAPASTTTDAATTNAATPASTTTDAATTSAAITGATATGASTAGTPTPATTTPATAETAATKAADEHKQFSSAEDAPYAIVSIQATGIHPKTSRLVSLGVSTADSSGNIVDTWHVVINPTEDPGPTHLHGLEPADFEGAPKFGVIQAKLAHALDGRTLVAHNAPLVWGFIVAEAKRARRQANRERSARNKRGRRRTRTRVARIPAPARIADTLETARRQGKRLDDARLRAVARAYGLDVPSPEASIARISVPERVRTLDDVTTTLALFRAQGGLDEGATLNMYTPDQLREDIVGLQRSTVRVDAMEAPRPVENPGRYTPGRQLAEGMEFVVAPEVSLDPDELIAAGVRAGLAYSEKVTRESSVLVCNRPADVTPDQLTGKAMHAHRKDIPIVSDEAFLRLVGEMEK
ncbi:exonuclease domain-containing protein [Corynebacterium amycolatum]|uniref:exonuclease domain-containing protein n=1 Tax=Corynebacterium amycolatum TaxID=43765 RepID=UPI001C404090|nr:exonuclease domain-containing protein [Corynebacterium amycolatum]MDC7119407.1 exonuclease domain-containing protein [Corynebacterium amycolatum]